MRLTRSLVLTYAVAVTSLVACGGEGGGASGGDNANMSISVDTTSHKAALVGQLTDFDITIDNTGKADIPKLGIMFDDGDHFLDHYTVLTSGICTVDKSLPGLACGLLAVGKELKFTMTAQPRDAGNFTFKFHIANGGLYLDEADGKGYTYSWTQTVLSG